MELNIEKMLFEVPENVEFPIELCHHLKTKLCTVIEDNCQLKRHITYLDKEVSDLRKSSLEQQREIKSPVNRISTPTNLEQPDSLMASKIVELSKRNRDLTAQMESMKTKLKKVMCENDQLKCSAELQQGKDVDDKTISECIGTLNTQTEEDVMSSSQQSQLSQITSKMMEYRRQSQQLRIELKTALRALSQEVGDSATPQTILNTVSCSSWRGRQQQIITLQQKVADLQLKCKSEPLSLGGSVMDASVGHGEGDTTLSEASFSMSKKASNVNSFVSVSSTAPPSHRIGLMQQDMKKQEQIRKLTTEVEQLSLDLKNRQHDLKASKARIQTLESQSKSYRNQVDLLEAKIQEKDFEIKNIWEEMNQLKQDLMAVKDREKRNRDKSSLEIQEGTRALTRERAIVGRLQKVINEKQEAIQQADSEIIELKNKLELCCSSKVAGGLNALDRLQELEKQLCHQSQILASSEKERHRLIDLVDKSVAEAERERNKIIQAQRESAQVFVVLQHANKCIDECLDTANVTDQNLLQEVENIRTMIRELKTGDLLYSFNNNNDTTGTPKKLKTKVDLLNKEVSILRANLRELTEAQKREMSKHARVYENLKQELVSTMQPVSNKRML